MPGSEFVNLLRPYLNNRNIEVEWEDGFSVLVPGILYVCFW